MDKSKWGTVFIMFASSLWAIDAIFRTQLTFSIPTTWIVMIEHALGFMFLSPFLLPHLDKIRNLSVRDWSILLLMTVVSSVLGTVLFTEALARSFAEFDFVTPLLLQKLQPVFVILLSVMFLKEKLTPKFIGFAAIALLGSYLISFGFQPVHFELSGKEMIVILSLGAAFAWGSGTILSKYALRRLPYTAVSALRFLMAVPVAYIFSRILGQSHNILTIQPMEWGRFLIIAGLTGGAFAIFWYYRGLKHVPARVSTIAELMFPIISIAIAVTPLNPYGAPQSLSMANIVGIVLLLAAILAIGFFQKQEITGEEQR